MPARFDFARIQDLRDRLDTHPVYHALHDLDDLRVFMAHHVFSVWDFMSMVKYLQQCIAPVRIPWAPHSHPSVRHFINQLVLEEESDAGLPDASGQPTHASHFELYCGAMKEIGADPAAVRRFVARAAHEGIEAAFAMDAAPPAAQRFMRSTFGFIASQQPHVVAAAFALGREHIIPGMFRAFLQRMDIDEADAPTFHFYLKRHIHLDEDFHGPISLLLLEELCDGDVARLREAEQAARTAIEARIDFWDGILHALRNGTPLTPAGQERHAHAHVDDSGKHPETAQFGIRATSPQSD